MNTPNTEMLRTRVDIFVLNAVSKKDGYGYDILNDIQTRTQGHYEMKQSSVYNILKRLENQGYLSGYQGDETHGGKRRYYAITELGMEYLQAQKTEWEYTRTLLDNLISDKIFDLQNAKAPYSPSDLRPFTPRKPRKTQNTATTELVAQVTPKVEMAEKAVNQEMPKSDAEMAEIAVNQEISKASDANIAVATDKVAACSANDVSTLTKDAHYINDDTDDVLSPAPTDTVSPKESVAATTTYATMDTGLNAKLQASIDKELEDESYKILFEEIFGSNARKDEIQDMDTTVDCKHINDLRLLLSKEGHKVSTYAPTSNKNYMRYIFTAKLNRDISIISYLFFVLMLLTVHLAHDKFAVSNKVLISLGCIGIIIPIVCLIQYFANPSKRKKDNIRLNVVIPICLVFYIAFLVLNIIIELLIPSGHSINSPQIYAPSIIALVIPFFGIVFTVLYKSNLYHQKVR